MEWDRHTRQEQAQPVEKESVVEGIWLAHSAGVHKRAVDRPHTLGRDRLLCQRCDVRLDQRAVLTKKRGWMYVDRPIETGEPYCLTAAKVPSALQSVPVM